MKFLSSYGFIVYALKKPVQFIVADSIYAKIVIEGGQLSFKIQKDDDVPICESVNVSLSDEFDVKIEESGIYTVTVTGAKAKGSISFTVESSQ